MVSWLYLLGAVVFEVLGTTCMKLSYGFSRLWPVMGVFAFYSVCFVLMSLAMKRLDMGIVYAVWCGLGLVLICVLDYYMFSARLGLSQWLAIGLIMSGIMILKWS
ncbi:Methyl viologen resistance protein C [Piscirickettsia salmonis]|uniref:DMT family transporter n=1 Tax=Piscirickettsia salmonis TaxID=1238 RepID=UPI001E625533|nr:multidrug efflux SMR transporter [Piscirickettsia salmonis]QGP49875.1 Methyl viologen resistance protein C [Piscirickettsia salmonis]QGP55064.1 Methyl viologen resistance protein C [Piscirickettsia salmonis]QGP59069.1 Methyl viologen resistance protein C [Piscirickettsia salmonis]QGP64631.1 Methyl viologen resistance protein C [Piscirickettsia salmonis]